MKCKKCGEEVTEEAFEFAQDNDYWRGESHTDCGCMKDDGEGVKACNCKF